MKRALLALLVVPLVALLASPASAQSDESEIRSVVVEATVNRDGSMDVVETLAYDFTAERNGGFRTFVPGGLDYEIVGFRVTEDGEPRDLAPGFDEPNTGAPVRWFGSADHSKVTGRHDYELTYRIEDAVDVFPDVAVLNWRFVGTDFPQLDEVRVDVRFPEGVGELRAFAHGVLHGVVEPAGTSVALRVVDNPAGVFVEARILGDVAGFDVAPSGPASLERILAEEAAFADAANRQREEARAAVAEVFEQEIDRDPPGDCDGADGELGRRCDRLDALLESARAARGDLDADDVQVLLDLQAARADVDAELQRRDDERDRLVLNVMGVVVAVVGAAAWYAVWRRSGKDPARPSDIGEYWREVPSEPPAVVASIDDWGGVDSKALVATLVDLAQRGWLTITPEGNDHRFTRSSKAEGEPLRDYEAAVLWRLFPTGRHAVTQEELTDEAKADPTVSAAWLRGFRSQVRADYDSHGYQARTGCLPWLLHAVIVVIVGLIGVGGLGISAWIGGGVATATAVVLLVLSPLLRRRTEKGARKLAEVTGLKRFLEHFSLVDDVPIGHLALYERYLVYAVALGVADQLIAGLRVRIPEVASDPSFAPWYGHAYVGATVGGGGFDRLADLGSLDSFAADFSRSTAAAFSPPSSSSGGGGGFSGGGGSSGGGGGGGAGSW